MKLKIIQDTTEVADPRGWDNLGTMVCFHGGYNLGDNHDYRRSHYSSWGELKRAIIRDNGPVVILPLYLYDHSGITMNTTGFSCPWDSGQVGWIFVSNKKIREEYGLKKVSAKKRKQVEEYLKGEVETYDQYLTGDVYGFVFEDDNGEEDSCWGFYGTDWKTNGLTDYLPKAAHHLLEDIEITY